MEITSKYQTVEHGTANTATTLTELFTMLAVKRLGGHASWDDIVEELRKFGIAIVKDTMQTKVKRATELFDVSDGEVSLKELGAGLQLTFLLDTICALSIRHSEPEPPWFHHALNRISKCTWTPSGFTAEVKKRHVRIIKKKRPNDSGVTDEQSLFDQTDQKLEKDEAPPDRPPQEPTSDEFGDQALAKRR